MRKKLCFLCKEKEAGEPQNISFDYNGFGPTIFKNELTCAECTKQEWIEKFKKHGQNLVRLEKGEIKVNWKVFSAAQKGRDWLKRAETMIDILISLGILSSKSEGNWEIVNEEALGLNPRIHNRYLFFRRQEDVLEFARLNFAFTIVNWEIRHIADEVLKKERVLKI